MFFLLQLNLGYAQTNQALTKKWKVETYYAVDQGNTLHFFHKDSAHNVVDYSKLKFEFYSNGTYKTQVNDSISYLNSWSIAQDSLRLDTQRYFLSSLSANSFTIKSYSYEYADTAARLDTISNYMRFIHDNPADDGDGNGGVVAAVESGLQDKALNVYPNPTKGLLTIELATDHVQNTVKQIRIISVTGQSIRKTIVNTKIKTFDMDIHDLKVGEYIIELRDAQNNRIGTKRVLKE